MESVSVLFVLPSGGGGGGPNSVAQETMGLARLGVDARIGVNAPKDVAVHREEIYERIKREEDQETRSGSPSSMVDDA